MNTFVGPLTEEERLRRQAEAAAKAAAEEAAASTQQQTTAATTQNLSPYRNPAARGAQVNAADEFSEVFPNGVGLPGRPAAQKDKFPLLDLFEKDEGKKGVSETGTEKSDATPASNPIADIVTEQTGIIDTLAEAESEAVKTEKEFDYAGAVAGARSNTKFKVVGTYKKDPYELATSEQLAEWEKNPDAEKDYGYNEITVDFSSFQNPEQAVLFASSLYDDETRRQFLKDYSDYKNYEYDDLIAFGVDKLGDNFFDDAANILSKEALNILNLQRENKAITDTFASFGLSGYGGKALNFNTASFEEIIAFASMNPDDETRDQIADLIGTAVKTKGNRFYGRDFEKSDITKYLATADFDKRKYDAFVGSYLTGKFFRDVGHDEENALAYEKAMAHIDSLNLSETQKDIYRKAVDLALYRQAGAYYEPGADTNGQNAADATGEDAGVEPGTSDDSRTILDAIAGMFGAKTERAPQSAPVRPKGKIGRGGNSGIMLVSANTGIKPNVPSGTNTTPQNPAATSDSKGEFSVKKPKSRSTEEFISDTVKMGEWLKGMAGADWSWMQPKDYTSTQRPPLPGSLDLSADPLAALNEINLGNRYLLTPESLAAVNAYSRSSPGKMAMLGVLTPENVERFGYIDDNGKIVEEDNNELASSIYRDNYGILGYELSGIAMRMASPDYPQEAWLLTAKALGEYIEKAEAAARADREGLYDPDLVNIYVQYGELNPNALDPVRDAVALADELEAERMAKAALMADAPEKDIQERLKQAQTAFRQNTPSAEDMDIMSKYAPDIDGYELTKDPAFSGILNHIIDELYNPNVTHDDWLDKKAAAYLDMKTRLGATEDDVTLQYAKYIINAYEQDALEQYAEIAISLGYESFGDYCKKNGFTLDTVRSMALYNLAMDERKEANSEAESAATQIAKDAAHVPNDKPVYSGKDGDTGLLERFFKSVEHGGHSWVELNSEAWYVYCESMLNRSVDPYRARAIYTNNYGLVNAAPRLSTELYAMCDSGYFPNEEFAKIVKRHLDNGGDPFELGIVPGDMGYLVKAHDYSEKEMRRLEEWSYKNLTPGQGRWFGINSNTTQNNINQAVAISLNLLTGGKLTLLNTMAAFGANPFVENFERGAKNGYNLQQSGMMGTAGVFATGLANMNTAASHAKNIKGLVSAINVTSATASLPQMLRWFSGASRVVAAGVGAAAKTAVDEVIVDEYKEGIATDLIVGSTEHIIENGENATIGSAVSSGLGKTDFFGTLKEVFGNAPEMAYEMLPTILMSGFVGGAKNFGSYSKIKKAMKTGDPADIKDAMDAFAVDLSDPENVEEIVEAIDSIHQASVAAEVLSQEGEASAQLQSGLDALEQAEAHKESLDTSQAALDEAVQQHEEAVDAVASGVVSEDVVQQAIDSAEAIAENQTSVSEHSREYEQKSDEANKTIQGAIDTAMVEAAQQIAAESEAEATQSQSYSPENPASYVGGLIKAANKISGKIGEVISIVGKSIDDFPIVKLNNGDTISLGNLDWDIETEAYEDIANQYTEIKDKLPTLVEETDGKWTEQKPKKSLLSQGYATKFAPKIGSDKEITVVDVVGKTKDGVAIVETDDGYYVIATALNYGDGKLIGDIYKAASQNDLPVFSDGSYYTEDDLKKEAEEEAWNQQILAEADSFDSEIDSSEGFDISDDLLLDDFDIDDDQDADESTDDGESNGAEENQVPADQNSAQQEPGENKPKGTVHKLLPKEYEAEYSASIGNDAKVTVTDVVGKTANGAPVVQLSDGTKVTVYALKNPELKKEVVSIAVANPDALPYLNTGEYLTISDLKAQNGTTGKTTKKKSAPQIQLEDWQDAKNHGAVNEPKKVPTDTPEFKAWFNDPTGDLTNDNGTPKIIYRGFGGMGSGTVYMQHESKPHNGHPVNFYSAILDMSKSYSSGNPKIVKNYDIKNWETAKAAMEDVGGKLITDSARKGYQVINRSGTKGKFYRENELAKFNKEYGGVKGAGIHAGYLSVQKPLVLDAHGKSYTSLTATVLDKDGNAYSDTKKARHWAHWAWDNGYDSVIIRNVKDNLSGNGSGTKPGLEVITKNPSAFKSIYNTGKFDKNNPDIRYYKPGTFKLTGKPVSQQMINLLNRLSAGEKVTAAEVYATPEVQYAIEHEKKGSSHEDYKNDPERAIVRQGILDELTSLGSAESVIGVDGKRKIVYTGDVKQERRLDVVIGPPAAGKSSVLVDPLSHIHKSRVVDSDMVKELLPEYEGGLNSGYLHEESSLINKQLLKESMERGDNIVLPVVGWHTESFRNSIKAYKAAGYKVHLHLNQLPVEKALGRMLNRLLTDGRYILPEYLLENVKDKPNSTFDIMLFEEAVDGYSRWSNDVPYGKDPILLHGDGKTEQSVVEGRRALASDAGGDRENPGGTPPTGPAEGASGSAGQGAEKENLKLLKSTQSNQGAPSVSGSETKKKAEAKSPMKIGKKLADDIGTAVYATKKLTNPHSLVAMPKEVKAYYSDMLDIVGVRTKDSGKLVELFHELSHAIGNKIGMQGTKRMIDALPDSFKNGYSASELPGEAMAEFGWKYIFNPGVAEQIAGKKFVAEFEKALKKEGLYKAVKEAQEEMQLYRNQETTGRTLSHVVDAPSKKSVTFEKLVAKTLDETAVLQPIVSAIRKQIGKSFVPANLNPVTQARQAQTASIRADRVFDNGVTDANWKLKAKGFDRVTKHLKNKDDVDLYMALLLDEHAIDRNAQEKPVFDEFVLPDSALRENVERIRNNYPHVAKAVDETHAFWADVMQNYMVDTGSLSQEAWDYLQKIYPHYVPTLRDKLSGGATTAGGKGNLIKRATGSTEDVINPLISMRAMVGAMVEQVSLNNIALTIDRAYKMYPEAMAEFCVPIHKGTKIKPLSEQELVEVMANLKPGDDVMQAIFDKQAEKAAFASPSTSGERDILVVQHPDGTTTEYKFSDPDMLKLLTGSGEKAVRGLASFVGKLTRTLAATATSDNPMYGLLRNPSKDISESIKHGSWAYTYIDGIPKWLLAAADVIRGTDNYKQYLATGAGGLSMFQATNQRSAESFLGSLFGKNYTPKSKIGRIRKIKESVFDISTVAKFAEFIEQTSRYAEAKYGKSGLKHLNAEEGGFTQLGVDIRDVTVDFYGRGSDQIMTDLAHVSPFFRAALNGVYRQGRTYLDPQERNRLPARVAKGIVNTAMASAASALLMLRYADDEDKEAYTEYLSQNLKTQHWYIPNPMYKNGSDKAFIRIPLPQDPLAYATHAAVTNAIWRGEGDSLAIEASALMDTIIGSVTPWSGTVFQPFIDASANRTWYGGSIVPRSMIDYNKISPANQYTETTPTFFRGVSNAMTHIGAEVSPMKLQYVTEQMLGYPAKMFVAFASPDEYTGQLGGLSAVAEVWEKTVTSDPYVSQDMTSTFYDGKDILTQLVNDAKAGKSVLKLKSGLDQNEVDNAVMDAENLLDGPIEDGADAIKAMYAQVDEINANRTLDAAQKNELIRQARRECFEILSDVNAELWAYQEQYLTGEGLIGHFIRNNKTYSYAD